jgi:phosphocarrier protein HPr
MPTASKDIIVRNKNGLHARPAMEFVDLANSFAASIKVKRTDDMAVEADGKSIMQMMILEAMPGTPLRIEADGEDADAAVARLAELFERFGED